MNGGQGTNIQSIVHGVCETIKIMCKVFACAHFFWRKVSVAFIKLLSNT